MINKPIVIALNSSTYTRIAIPFTGSPIPVSYYTEDETAFYVAVTVGGEGEALIPEKSKVNDPQAIVDKETGTLVWAKSSTGTPNLVVLTGTATGLLGR
ncbi:MAG: hypothetical protein JRC86_04540 [Deltaproteobacteria bacterium]|nr:hypothetical protein [Deltaproteobacteria bacterium]